MTCLALSVLAAAVARAETIQFDDQAPGTVLANQYPAVSFMNGPVVSAHAYVSKWQCLAQVEPTTAKSTDGGGAVGLNFGVPQSRVRLRAGYALDPGATKGGPATITVTAWGYDNKTGTWYVAGTSTGTVAGPGVFTTIEVCRPFTGDIAGLDIEASGSRIELVDNLEFFSDAGSPAWTVKFDDVPAGSLVTGQYPGVQFTDAARAVGAETMGATAASAPQVVRADYGAESHTQDFSFELEPPQGAVKLLTGYPGSAWDGNPLTVRVTAYNGAGVELGRVERTYAAVRPLTDPVSICRWDQRDIAKVSVHFLGAGGIARSLGGEECFDNLQFGPVDPASLNDATAPLVYISAPAGADVSEVMATASDNTRTFALDAYSFEDVSLAAMWIEQENVATGAVTTIPLTFTQRGEIPSYTPVGGAPVAVPAGYEVQTATTLITYGAGNWRFRVYARDTAGNVSVVSGANERVRSLVPLGASVYTPNAGEITFMGVAPEASLGMPWAPPASAMVTNYILRGERLHRDSRVYFVRGQNSEAPWSRENYMAPVVSGSLRGDRTAVEVVIPGVCTDLAANEGANQWEMWVRDSWARPGVVEWAKLGNVRVGPWFPEMYGYSFANVGDNSFGLAAFDCIYGRTLMLGGGRSGIRNPSRMLFAAVGLPILSGGEGHCFGYSMTVSHMRRGWLNPRLYGRPDAVTANEIPELGTESYRGGDLFELALPGSLFAQIMAFHGGQLSDEVIHHVLGQMSGGFSWRGNPNATLERIRANPHDYIVTMLSVDELSRSHVLTPYAVRDIDGTTSEILVYDSNFPGKPAASGDGRQNFLREACRNTRILVNRVTNTYSYCLNDPFRGPEGTYLSGTGLYTIPVNMFLGDRTPPGIARLLGRALVMLVAGDALPRYEGAGGAVGFNADGSEVYTLNGAYVMPLSDGIPATEGASPFTTVVPGTEIGQIEAKVRYTGSSGHFYAADSGVVFQLSSTGATAGETDRVVIDRAVTPLDGVALIPGGNGRTWYPRVGIESADGSALAWRVLGLRLEAGERLEFVPRTGSEGGGDEWLDLRNRSGRALEFRLVLERGTAASSAPDAASYGPFTIPAGGDVRLYPLAGGRMNFAVDANADGVPETVDGISGGALYSGQVAVAGSDCDGNGVPDALDIAEGRAADRNGNLIPDSCESAPAAVVTLVAVDRKASGNAVTLSLEGTPGTTWTLERSSDLVKWAVVETVTMTEGAVSRTVSEPAEAARVFYRLRHD
jgi:hypothetical protein